MNIKHKQILIALFLNFLIICIFQSVNVKAQSYDLQLNVNDEFVWEIKELNKDKFEFTFNTEPNFEIGDQIKMIIREISESGGIKWTVVVEFWDYGTDWNINGEIQTLSINFSPLRYEDPLFVPTPVDDFLEIAVENLPSEYYLESSLTIGRQARSDSLINYKVEKSFDINGILIAETYFDEGYSVIVKLEGTFLLVPLGFSFIGFMVIAIISIIAIFLKKNKIRFV